MRPLPSRDRTIRGQVPGRPDSLTSAPAPAPMSCFIANEADIDRVREGGRSRFRHQPDRRKYLDGSRQSAGPSQWASPLRAQGSASSLSELGHDILADFSRPDTPLMAGFSGAESALSSTSSRRSSIAISSFEYESSRNGPAPLSQRESVDADELEDELGPQLIMPSLMVPRRAPFSEVGKSLGKLKIMVSGQTGIGKTSLIRSLAQRSEHIVHMDPIMPTGTAHAAETYASSRPQPWWQTEASSHTPTERRRSSVGMGEMLDRNVCFVESPSPTDGVKTLWRDDNYVESCLNPLLSKSMNDSDLLAIINAGGESVVDALLYLVSSKGLETEDIEYIRNAQKMTNVIPILARSDELDREAVELAKATILQQIIDEDLDCFSFASPESLEEALHVYAVSTQTQTDYDMIDASVLMNSDYLPPLVPTDLGHLVDRLFSVDGSSQLRHSAATKCVKWRRDHSQGVMDSTLQGTWSLVHRPRPDLPINLCRRSTLDTSWARVDLYNWAHNLRQSLHTERIYHLMTSGAQLQAQAAESRLVPLNSPSPRCQQQQPTPRHQDPLGILELGSFLKRKGVLILEMLSALGLLSYVISRLTRPAWNGASYHGAFRGLGRAGFDVSMLGTLLS